MSGGERVEDTRTLQPGDPVRVVLEGTVEAANQPDTYWRFRTDIGARLWVWQHAESEGQVYRLPKPLPPEPDPGAQVLDRDGVVWLRQDDSSLNPRLRWRTMPEDWGWETWRTLLTARGPVRLLGDPIEAPR